VSIQSSGKDRWQESLDIQLDRLKKCQRELGLHSCLSCEKILECELRTRYVKAVYESMNKGEGGGFEF